MSGSGSVGSEQPRLLQGAWLRPTTWVGQGEAIRMRFLRTTRRKLVLVGFVAVCAFGGVAVYAAFAGTNPPATYGMGFLPIVYSSTNGSMRLVRPWGITGDSVPTCTPPAA